MNKKLLVFTTLLILCLFTGMSAASTAHGVAATVEQTVKQINVSKDGGSFDVSNKVILTQDRDLAEFKINKPLPIMSKWQISNLQFDEKTFPDHSYGVDQYGNVGIHYAWSRFGHIPAGTYYFNYTLTVGNPEQIGSYFLNSSWSDDEEFGHEFPMRGDTGPCIEVSDTIHVVDNTTGDDGNTTPPTNNTTIVANAGPDMSGVVGTPILFDGSKSIAPTGSTYSWDWDFDISDGVISQLTGVTPKYNYKTPGTRTVQLTITTPDGHKYTDIANVTVAPKPNDASGAITTVRHLPSVANVNAITVSVDITANQDLSALAFDEELPAGFSASNVRPLDLNGATFKPDTLQWLWSDSMQAGQTKHITYRLTLPANVDLNATFGNAYSNAYKVDNCPVTGDNKFSTSTDWNPWNDNNSEQGKLITLSELQEAIDCWVNDIPAPVTNAEVTTTRMQAMVYFWVKNLEMNEGEE